MSSSKTARAKAVGCEEPRIFTPPLRRLTPKTSHGFQAVEFAEQVIGIELLPWQRWLLIHALELRQDGSYRFRTVVVLVARQSGKSTLLQILALWRMYLSAGARLVIGTAQNLDIAEEVWQGAVDLVDEVPELKSEVARVDKTNGKKSLTLTSRSRYKVQAANRRGGRGLSGDLILMDELREHQSWDSWGAVTKTTMARHEAQVWAASNAGDTASIVLRFLRELAHEALGDPDGLLGGESRAVDDDLDDGDSLGIFEWSAPPDCAISDREGWAQANPALGHTISERAIASAARTDPEWVFRTEVLCQWAPMALDAVIDLRSWAALADEDATPTGPLVLGIDVAPGHSSASVVATDGQVVELVERRTGAAWLPARVRELQDKHGVTAVAFDPAGPIGSLVPELEQAGVSLSPIDGKNSVRSCGSFVSAVGEAAFKHRNDPDLTAAVVGCRRRAVGDGHKWSRKDSTVDISPLVAASLALWAASAVEAPVSGFALVIS